MSSKGIGEGRGDVPSVILIPRIGSPAPEGVGALEREHRLWDVRLGYYDSSLGAEKGHYLRAR